MCVDSDSCTAIMVGPCHSMHETEGEDGKSLATSAVILLVLSLADGLSELGSRIR